MSKRNPILPPPDVRMAIALAGDISYGSVTKGFKGEHLTSTVARRFARECAKRGLAVPHAPMAASTGASFGDASAAVDLRCPTCRITRGMRGDGTAAPCLHCRPRGDVSGVRFGDPR